MLAAAKLVEPLVMLLAGYEKASPKVKDDFFAVTGCTADLGLHLAASTLEQRIKAAARLGTAQVWDSIMIRCSKRRSSSRTRVKGVTGVAAGDAFFIREKDHEDRSFRRHPRSNHGDCLLGAKTRRVGGQARVVAASRHTNDRRGLGRVQR